MNAHIIYHARSEIPFEFFSLRNYFEPFVYYLIFWFSTPAGWRNEWELGWGKWPFPFFLPWLWLLLYLFVAAFYYLRAWWKTIYFPFPWLVSFILFLFEEVSRFSDTLFAGSSYEFSKTLSIFCPASSLELTTGEIKFASYWSVCRESASFKFFDFI